MPIWAAPTAICAPASAPSNCCIRCRAAPGRAEKPGLVLLQTRNPDDAVMQALARGDRDGFYEQERGFRERAPGAALRPPRRAHALRL